MAPSEPAPRQQVGQLPLAVTSPVDLSRLIRELEALGDHLHQQVLGSPEDPAVMKISPLLRITAELNHIDVYKASERQSLQAFLADVKKQAPVIHISFSADPPQNFIEKVIKWLRREIHPLMLLRIGLQPNIGAGCVVRTTNRYFDLSLRKAFEGKRELLLQKITEVTK